jgi:hypothetical protein
MACSIRPVKMAMAAWLYHVASPEAGAAAEAR